MPSFTTILIREVFNNAVSANTDSFGIVDWDKAEVMFVKTLLEKRLNIEISHMFEMLKEER